MAISISVYSNANSSSKSITFDFVGDILAADDFPANAACNAFYFKVTAGTTQDNNVAFPVKIVSSLSDLVLKPRSATQKQRITNTNAAYTNVRSMVIDYVYDYINGHTANLYGSHCTEQRPMKFR